MLVRGLLYNVVMGTPVAELKMTDPVGLVQPDALTPIAVAVNNVTVVPAEDT